MSQKDSPAKGKRSLMDMIKGGSKKGVTSPIRTTRKRVLTPQRKHSGVDKIEALGILTPNTRQLVNNNNVKSNKIFNDSVHTNITLEPVCVRIVDTPQYQRLHGLKQLGTCDFVFRGATHTRFEHSLGVAHMAARVVRTLKNNQPELGISDKDVLCVKIAGLCHDLGHGPFSHVFDGVFIKKMFPNGIDEQGKKWRHEDGSVQMFRYLLSDNDINLGDDYGLNASDVLFVEEIISGTKESLRRGRTRNKFFLYDVVNNARSGLDVDKLDYFQRDMSRCGVSTGSSSRDFDRFVVNAVVMNAEPIEQGHSRGRGKSKTSSSSSSFPSSSFTSSQSQGTDGEIVDEEQEEEEFPLMICYPEKMVRETVSLFATRFNMHQLVYTHKSVKQVEFMVTDALELADPHIRIQGFLDGLYKMSETIHDMKAFMAMKDSILDLICFAATTNEQLKPAQELIGRIHRRELYRYIGTTSSLCGGAGEGISGKSEEDILQEILAISMRKREEEEYSFNLGDEDNAHLGYGMSPGASSGYVELCAHDLIVEKMRIHYGMGSENPVNRMRFFPKHANLHRQHAAQQLAQTKHHSNGIGRLMGQAKGPVARRIDECVYETVLPRVFEDRAVRLFCRDPHKADAARAVFEQWCEEANAQMPFPSLSQSQGGENSQHDMLFGGELY